jgi:rsbT co-antagonist protein RsbR
MGEMKRMSKAPQNRSGNLGEFLAKDESQLLSDWLKEMTASIRRSDLIKDSELRSQCSLFLKLLRQGADSGSADLEEPAWEPMRELMGEVSRTRAPMRIP